MSDKKGFFARLFGAGRRAASPTAEPVDYEGFRIFPAPMSEDGGYRLAARIEKGDGEAKKTHKLIRADLIRDPDEAAKAAIAKAKQLIDQMGDRLFG